jgi:hypothetical protein
MNITNGLRRTRTPKVPIAKSMADKIKYQDEVGVKLKEII